MKVMDHAHGAKQVDVEHALYGNDVRIDSRHGVCYTTTKKERGKSAHAHRFSLCRLFSKDTYAQFTRISSRPPVSFCKLAFSSRMESSLVTSGGKKVISARDRWSLASFGSTVAMGWMPRRLYSRTRASPIPPWPHLFVHFFST